MGLPDSNCRDEVGLRTTKRLLADNTGPNGDLDTDQVQRAVLLYRNTPDTTTQISPVMAVFGRPIRDFKSEPHQIWKEKLQAREEALRVRHKQSAERLSEHTKLLPQLKVGGLIRIQNQTGLHPLKCDKTRQIIEGRQYDQYAVKVDGSSRITLRNRRLVRKYDPYVTPALRRGIQENILCLPRMLAAQTVKTPQSYAPAKSQACSSSSLACFTYRPHPPTPASSLHLPHLILHLFLF